MVAVALLRGLQVSVPTLDVFLAASGIDETYGAPPFTEDHPDKDAISALLHVKLGTDADPQRMARVIIPQRIDMNRFTVAYVAYAWVMVFAHRQIQLDADLPPEPPAAFEALCREILGFSREDSESVPGEGTVGLFLVNTDEGKYVPETLKKRKEVCLDRLRVYLRGCCERLTILAQLHTIQFPQLCDQCDENFETLDAWQRRQAHRRLVHGSSEGDAPLPEA